MGATTNPQCPDYSSHAQNARDALDVVAQRPIPDNELTADDHEWIDAVAEREYSECQGH